jgi:ABC-2 type transport system permease protein
VYSFVVSVGGLKTDVTEISAVDAAWDVKFRETVKDLAVSMLWYQIWWRLAVRTVGSSYRKTYLGPLWMSLTVVSGALVLAAFRVSTSPGLKFSETFAFVGIGYVVYSHICNGYSAATKCFLWPVHSAMRADLMSLAIFKSVAIQVIELFHEFLPLLVLAMLLSGKPIDNLWLLIVTLFLMVASAVGQNLWLGCLGARFRDLSPIISILNRLQLFLCPVFWSYSEVSDASGLRTVSRFLPVTHFVNLAREASIGGNSSYHPTELAFLLLYAFANGVLGLLVYASWRKNLTYWVANS